MQLAPVQLLQKYDLHVWNGKNLCWKLASLYLSTSFV